MFKFEENLQVNDLKTWPASRIQMEIETIVIGIKLYNKQEGFW